VVIKRGVTGDKKTRPFSGRAKIHVTQHKNDEAAVSMCNPTGALHPKFTLTALSYIN
jgi:hypothetical protein